MKIYTIGHSTRSIQEFIEILNEYGIDLVVDVRSIPYSEHNPQFNEDRFEEALNEKDIKYMHMGELGGFRSPKADSINMAWENKHFRGYADYMQTKEFKMALEELIKLAQKHSLVIMCSESVPWRCHRSLIADALMIRDVKVIDIYNIHTIKKHKLTPWAKVDGTQITYPK